MNRKGILILLGLSVYSGVCTAGSARLKLATSGVAMLFKTSREAAHQGNQMLMYQALRELGYKKSDIVTLNSPELNHANQSRTVSYQGDFNTTRGESHSASALSSYLLFTHMIQERINEGDTLTDYDGDGTSDIDYSASSSNLERAFRDLKDKLEDSRGKQAFLYFNGHGSTSTNASGEVEAYLNLETREGSFRIRATRIKRLIDRYIAKNIQLVVMIQACSSGSFRHHLSDDRTILLTSAGDFNSSYMGTPTGELGSHFTYNTISAIRGEDTEGAEVNADKNGDGFVTLREAYDYSKDGYPHVVKTIRGIIPSRDVGVFIVLNWALFEDAGLLGYLVSPLSYAFTPHANGTWTTGPLFKYTQGSQDTELSIIEKRGDTPMLFAPDFVDYSLELVRFI